MLYRGIIKEKPLYLKVAAVVLSIVSTVLIFIIKKYTYLVFPIVVVLAVILKKQHFVTENGVDIHYNLFGKDITTIWLWSEIDILSQNFEKVVPDVMCYFKKGMMTRAFVFNLKDAKAIRDYVTDNEKHIKVQIM